MVQRTLLANADLITLDDSDETLVETDLGIEGTEVAWVGQAPKGWTPHARIDLGGHVVLPGLWNAHTHAAMTLTRSLAEDLPIDRWFNERIWVAESGLTEDDIYWGSLLACAEMIRAGIVGFADHYFRSDRVAEAVGQAGLKALLAEPLFSAPPAIARDLSEALTLARQLEGSADGRIRVALGPHSTYLCSPDLLGEVAAAARQDGLPLHIHVAETHEQLEASRHEFGRSPVEHLAHLGIFGVPTIAAHCVAVIDADLDILSGLPVTVVQCPRCHMKLAMGTTPVPAMLERGIRVALGTDGPASNNNLDILAEVRLATLVARQASGDATVLPGDQALRLAARNGAEALGFKESGVLRPGMRADLIVLDLRRPHLQPIHSLIGAVVHAATSSDIVHTMVDGRWLMRDRRLETIDEESVVAEASRRAPTLLERGRARILTYPRSDGAPP